MEVENVLKDMGFKHIEIKIYLFLLRKGSISQQAISDENNILRQTVYEVMKKMELKGYVSSSLIGKRKVYFAVDPEIILNDFKNREENFSKIIPELTKLGKSRTNFFTQSFFGIKGLKNLFNMTLNSNREILWFCNRGVSDDIFQGFYWHNYSQKRIEKKIPIKLIIEPDDKKDWDTNKKALRKTRRNYLAKEVTSSFVIFDENILIYSQEEGNLQGVLIQSDSIQEMFRKFFDFLWGQSK